MQRAGGGQEIVVRVFGADARLDGVAVDLQLVLRQRQRLARCHAQLPFDHIQPGDGFGHRMLNLQPRVHFHEKEIHAAISALLDDEFHRACAHIVDRTGCGHGGFAHLGAHFRRHAGRGGFFQHLLVAALHRAIALEQVNVIALRIAEYLDFDVARTQGIFFNQHRVIPKAIDGFALARRQRGRKVFRRFNHAHAFSAATRASLDEHRVTDAVSFALQQGRVLIRAVVTRHQRDAGFFHQLLGLGFQAHRLDGGRRWADEDQPGAGAGLGKLFVFAQKSVAGVNRLGTGGFGRFDDFCPAQVAVFGRAAADVDGFVAKAHVLGAGVGV